MRAAKIDKTIIGKKFGKLTAIQFVNLDKRSRQMWLFKCDCGKNLIACLSIVRLGKIKSCGCFRKDEAIKRGKKSGDRIRENQLLGQQYCTNTTGVTGVYHYKKNNQWTAEITYKGKRYRVYCKNKEEAIEARKSLEEELGVYEKCLKSIS